MQLNLSSASQVVQQFMRELKSQGELIFSEAPDIHSLLAFSVNQTLFFHNKCQNHPFVWDVGN